MNNTRPHGRVRAAARAVKILLAAGLAASASLAQAGVADKVYQPVVEYREFEVELRGGHVRDSDPAVNTAQQYVLDFGYGVTPWWFTEAVGNFTREPGDSVRFDAYEFENIFQLTEQGKYWADVGFFVEYGHPKAKGDPDAIEFGPMIQKEVGPTINTLNLFAERQLGAGREKKTHGEYRFQSEWRSGWVLNPGVQAFGDLTGDDKAALLGPAVFGQVRLGKNKLKFDAGLPIGLNDSSPGLVFRWQLEFEFR